MVAAHLDDDDGLKRALRCAGSLVTAYLFHCPFCFDPLFIYALLAYTGSDLSAYHGVVDEWGRDFWDLHMGRRLGSGKNARPAARGAPHHQRSKLLPGTDSDRARGIS